jgi:hypothetical protein
MVERGHKEIILKWNDSLLTDKSPHITTDKIITNKVTPYILEHVLATDCHFQC